MKVVMWNSNGLACLICVEGGLSRRLHACLAMSMRPMRIAKRQWLTDLESRDWDPAMDWGSAWL